MSKDDIPRPTDSGISDVKLVEGRLHHSAIFEQVPDGEDFEEEEELSAITSLNDPDRVILKIGAFITRIERMLGMLDKRQHRMEIRLTAIERNGHPCKNQQLVDRLETESAEWREDKEQGIKTRAMVKSIAEDVGESKIKIDEMQRDTKKDASDRRKALVAIIICIIGLVAAIGGATWCIGTKLTGVSGDIRTERTLRDAQYEEVTRLLDKLPTTEQVPSREQVDDIRRVVKNGDEFLERCRRLSEVEKQRLERSVRAGHLPPEFLCP